MIQSIRTTYWNWLLDYLVARRDRLDARADAVEARILRIRKLLGLPVVKAWCPKATDALR